LARVEGEGSLKAEVIDGELGDIEFNIFEPPRFFEGFLRDRRFTEAPDITARICGICPIAYQISSVTAMEDVCGVAVDGGLHELRRLIYCGEYIESHALHVYLLHAPDFLGYDSGIAMAADHRAIVERGLRLKQTGNEIVRVLGGREIHPVNVRVGGFWRLPTRAELQGLATELDRARDEAMATVKWVSQLDIPQITRPVEFVALSDPDRYPFFEGRIKSTEGIDIAVSEWNDVFVEEQCTAAMRCTPECASAVCMRPAQPRGLPSTTRRSSRLPPGLPPRQGSNRVWRIPSKALWCGRLRY
jgi:coenzyme F420-reducing hydrogenase alpha subunit